VDIREQLLEMVTSDCKVVLVKSWWFSSGTLDKNVQELWISGMPQDFSQEDRKKYILSLLPVAASDEVLGSLGALLSVIYAQKLLSTVEVLSGERLHMLQSLSQFNLKEHLQYDLPTLSALQIFSSDKHPSNFIGNTKEGLSLYTLLDQCCTLHGRRMLKKWLLHPITNVEEIRDRHNQVDYLYNLPAEMLQSIQKTLSSVTNLSTILKQLISCQGSGKTNNCHLETLSRHVMCAVQLQELCSQLLHWRVPLAKVECVESLARLNGSEFTELLAALERTLDLRSESSTNSEDFFVAMGVSQPLDNLKSMYNKLPAILNHVIGQELQRIPPELVRKHEKTEWALLHLPRFGFVVKMPSLLPPDLLEVFTDYQFVSEFCDGYFLYKSDSTILLDNEFGNLYSKIQDLETAILSQFTFEILQVPLWQDLVEKTAKLDVILSFASVARAHNFHRPQVVDENVLQIKNGRHALNEQTVQGSFIPNDSTFLQDSERIHVITGPNFSGKTIYAKQVALIIFLAHVGSFVPADENSVIGVCDKMLTRIDSIDASSFGQSAFMMDLIQVLHSLRNATSRSFIFFDEFGRGTESSDGFGLFFSVLTAFAERPYPPRIIACTHFSCSAYLQHMPSNFHVAFRKMECFIERTTDGPAPSLHQENAEEGRNDSKVIYLYRLVQGISDNALGIFCARLAGLSESIWRRSYDILTARSKLGGCLETLVSTDESTTKGGIHERVDEFLKLDLAAINVKQFLSQKGGNVV
jgi:DNA mismatch repair protein MSH5